MGQSKRRRLIGEDGELTAASDAEVLYCSRCGTANAPDSNFCRKCGHSLEDQEAEMMGVPGRAGASSAQKTKHDLHREMEQEEREDPHTNVAVVQVLNTLFALGMGITAFVTEQSAAIIPIAVAWLGVEAIRGNRPLSSAQAAAQTLTALIVMGLSIAALVTGNGAAIIVLMVLWVALTAIRG